MVLTLQATTQTHRNKVQKNIFHDIVNKSRITIYKLHLKPNCPVQLFLGAILSILYHFEISENDVNTLIVE